MFWKILLVFVLSLLMFALGFFVGGIHWEWRTPSHAGDVAFWSMLGGWVSGLATLAAVIVSMYMAYQASQSDVEKLILQLKLPKTSIFQNSQLMNVKVQNMRNVHVDITDLKMTLDNVGTAYNLNHLVSGNAGQLSYPLERKGEIVNMTFIIDYCDAWSGIFDDIDKRNENHFKKATVLVETHMKTYQIPVPPGFLPIFRHSFEYWKEKKQTQHA